MQSDVQNLIDKLHNMYTGGAVVPLPFLKAADAAPLALLGIDDGLSGQDENELVRTVARIPRIMSLLRPATRLVIIIILLYAEVGRGFKKCFGRRWCR